MLPSSLIVSASMVSFPHTLPEWRLMSPGIKTLFGLRKDSKDFTAQTIGSLLLKTTTGKDPLAEITG